ncbi:Pectate lyase [Rhizoctonia solani]|uniref:pectin lyase n=1 Tax=Rhizoctonia solani TaxID=456999 RepID=A0A8H7M1L2_9AGAM|nr:Pectate lyase [Rhizoctonia solani]
MGINSLVSVVSTTAALIDSKGALAVGSLFGYAKGTTGRAAATQATPTSTAQLKSWLKDNVAHNILLNRTYDFTDTKSSVTETGCKPWTCSPNLQLAINPHNWCLEDAAKVTVTYKKAGTNSILVGSNKTILGKELQDGCLRLIGSTNIIIQNVRISDINPQYVWGGDAISLEGASKVWIDHNYIKSIGRQFLISHFDPTFKSQSRTTTLTGKAHGRELIQLYNQFKPSLYLVVINNSTRCNEHHYWSFYFVGKADEITFARNYIYHTAGRGPKVGGISGNTQSIHVYNNYWNDVTGNALEPNNGSRVLMEGNVFNKVKAPSSGGSAGTVFAPTSSSMNAQCSSVLSRNCVSNILTGGSGSLSNTGNTAAIRPFTASTVKSASVMDPSSVVSYVLANAGLVSFNVTVLKQVTIHASLGYSFTAQPLAAAPVMTSFLAPCSAPARGGTTAVPHDRVSVPPCSCIPPTNQRTQPGATAYFLHPGALNLAAAVDVALPPPERVYVEEPP